MKRTLLLLILSFNAFAAGRELAPGVYGPSALSASVPHVAFAGGKFLTVWRESVGGSTRIAGTFSDARGQRLSRRSFIVATDRNPMKLVGTGDSFALFTESLGHLDLVNIDGNGRATAPRPLGIQRLESFDAAWNGGHFLVTSSEWLLHGNQHALLLDRDGTVVRNGIRLTATREAQELVVSRPGSTRGTVIQRAETMEPPSIVAIGANVVIGVQESDPMEGGRATVYVERELRAQ